MDTRFITPLNKLSAVQLDTFSKFYGEELIAFISHLKESNSRSLERRFVSNTIPFLMLPSAVVRIFFATCSKFALSSEAKYLAMEIYDWFATLHFRELSEHVHSSSQNPDIMKKKWRLILKRVQKQMLLRILSSVQIASKVDFQPQPITVGMVYDILKKAGMSFHKHSIFKSELRVFKTLGCQVPLWTPLTYIHTILEVLNVWADVTQLTSICEKVLEATTLQRDEVYLRFFWMGTNRWERTLPERLECAAVEMDYFLLASAVVITALYIHPIIELNIDKASNILFELIETPVKDIQALALVIIQMILGRVQISEGMLNKMGTKPGR